MRRRRARSGFGELAVAVEVAPRLQARDRRGPVLVGPRPTRLQRERRQIAGRRVRDERFDPRQTVGPQQRDVTVAAVLAQQRLGVPQHEVGFVGPRQRGMTGEQRATRELVARGERGGASQTRELDQLRRSDGLTERAAQRGVRTLVARLEHLRR